MEASGVRCWARPGSTITAGTRFKLVAKPQPGWRGFVECEVLEARAPSVLRYSWVGDEKAKPMMASESAALRMMALPGFDRSARAARWAGRSRGRVNS